MQLALDNYGAPKILAGLEKSITPEQAQQVAGNICMSQMQDTGPMNCHVSRMAYLGANSMVLMEIGCRPHRCGHVERR